MNKVFLFLSILGIGFLQADDSVLKNQSIISIYNNVNVNEMGIEVPENYVQVPAKAPLHCESYGFSKSDLMFEDKNDFGEVKKDYMIRVSAERMRTCTETDYGQSDVAGSDNVAYYAK